MNKIHRQPTRQLMHRYEQPEKLTDQHEILMRLEDLYIKMDQILIHCLAVDGDTDGDTDGDADEELG